MNVIKNTAQWITLCTLALISWNCKQVDYSSSIDSTALPISGVVEKISFRDSYFEKRVLEKTKAFYQSNGFEKHWLDKSKPFPRLEAFFTELTEADRFGINPEDYNLSAVRDSVANLYENRSRSDENTSLLDVRITAAFFLYTTHITEGRIRFAGAKDFVWKKGMPDEDDVTLLLNSRSKGDLRKELDKLHPQTKHYHALTKALTYYRQLQEEPPPEVKPFTAKPGESHAQIPSLRRRLAAVNNVSLSSPEDSLRYEVDLEKAVRQYQRQWGLNEDGIIGESVLSVLNIAPEQLIEKVALNLERHRWQPRLSLNGPNIMVNIPEYKLTLFEDEKQVMEMRVVLGTEYNPTPIFADTLTYIVFSPTWTVPKSIIEEEFLPNLIENSGHYNKEVFQFTKNGEEIDPEEEDWDDKKLNIQEYQVVQRPGAANSLGRVKFMMPNNMAIYLHDTPADHLFVKQDRAFSHGCIRLEHPQDFAKYLLEKNDEDWTEEKIERAMKLDEPQEVPLKKRYPVHIVYRTAWVDENGFTNFREDIYGHDARQLQQLKKTTNIAAKNSLIYPLYSAATETELTFEVLASSELIIVSKLRKAELFRYVGS